MSSSGDSLYRSTRGRREPLARPGDGGDHVHYSPAKRCGVGCKTSQSGAPLTFFQQLAIRLGVTLAEAERLHREDLVT